MREARIARLFGLAFGGLLAACLVLNALAVLIISANSGIRSAPDVQAVFCRLSSIFQNWVSIITISAASPALPFTSPFGHRRNILYSLCPAPSSALDYPV
jgi:hypothetical protein